MARRWDAVSINAQISRPLGVKSVVDLLNGADRVPVQIASVKRAERLLADLAETSGRIVEKADEGVFLVQPAVHAPTVEEIVTQPVVEEIAQAERGSG